MVQKIRKIVKKLQNNRKSKTKKPKASIKWGSKEPEAGDFFYFEEPIQVETWHVKGEKKIKRTISTARVSSVDITLNKPTFTKKDENGKKYYFYINI
jgi:hypothetical protein